ncbi:MAG: arginine deiminase [Lachnospiraceae bacterium]|nr:arginine deiminase [Lachnospiraceae bacterium]
MTVNITSEIGRLEKVVLHRPGEELENLVPGELERLLFDDIPYLRIAKEEHDAFAEVLRENGAQVIYIEDLMADVLKEDPSLREPFICEVLKAAGTFEKGFGQAVFDYLKGIQDPKELVLRLISGISFEALSLTGANPLADLVNSGRRYALDPVPNLYFTRDALSGIGRGVSLSSMYSPVRRRETIFWKYILEHDPIFAGIPVFYNNESPFSIEGGDILNLNKTTIAVGISERTSPEAIEQLAKNLFASEESEIETVLALDIPNMRSFMHLDTVLTQADRDKFVIHPGVAGLIRVYRIRRGAEGGLEVREIMKPLAGVLAETLGVDRVSMIECGGSNRIASEREQWNDGSNTLCIAPGKVVTYDRNYVTNAILRDNGIEVFEIKSSELSRGRGGPRCMSMPLLRAEVS